MTNTFNKLKRKKEQIKDQIKMVDSKASILVITCKS